MNRIGAIILGISFIGIAVFGFSAMGHQGGKHLGCIAETLQGKSCPTEGIVGMASFYLNAFGKVTQANIISLAALAALLFALAVVLFVAAPQLLQDLAILNARPTEKGASIPLVLYLRQWFSLKENSPNISA